MGIIYKISNDINDKVYIGQTTNLLKKRWYDHCYSANHPRQDNDNVLYRAMRKYGVSHFSISVIEEVENDLLNEREIYWISQYNSYNPNGYNSTLGGDGHTRYDYSEILNYYLTVARHNATKTAEHFECSIQTVSKIVKCAGLDGAIGRFLVGQGIYKIDPATGEIVDYYDSVGLAALAEQCSTEAIESVLYKNRKTCKNFTWVYQKEYNPSNDYRVIDNRKKRVFCVEEEIAFESRSEAARWILEQNYSSDNINGIASNIGRAIRCSIRAYGFYWNEI